MSAELSRERYDVLAPMLGHFSDDAQRVDLVEQESRVQLQPSLCETQIAMLGSFSTAHGIISEVMIFNGAFKDYQLDQSVVLSEIDLGLDRLNMFASHHRDAFDHITKSAEEIIYSERDNDKTDFVAGIQVMFNTQYGDLRPELVYKIPSIDSMVFAPQLALLSGHPHGVGLEFSRIRDNDRAIEVINPNDETRAQLAITAASIILPKSLDYVI